MTVPPTTCLADVLALRGEPGLLDVRALAPVVAGASAVAGRAVTIELAEGDGGFGAMYELLSRDLTGAVVVVAGAEHVPGAVFGSILARAAAQRGAVAAVVSGGVRDRGDLHQEGLVVWGGRRETVGPNGRAEVKTVDAPVVVAGVRIAPGDTVVLDADGVVALPAGTATEQLAAGARYAAAEDEVLAALAAGEPLTRAYHHKKDAVAALVAEARASGQPPVHDQTTDASARAAAAPSRETPA